MSAKDTRGRLKECNADFEFVGVLGSDVYNLAANFFAGFGLADSEQLAERDFLHQKNQRVVRIDHGSAGFLREPLPIQAVAAVNNLHREHDALAAALLHILMQADRSGTQQYLLVTILVGMSGGFLDCWREQFGSRRVKKG